MDEAVEGVEGGGVGGRSPGIVVGVLDEGQEGVNEE